MGLAISLVSCEREKVGRIVVIIISTPRTKCSNFSGIYFSVFEYNFELNLYVGTLKE